MATTTQISHVEHPRYGAPKSIGSVYSKTPTQTKKSLRRGQISRAQALLVC